MCLKVKHEKKGGCPGRGAVMMLVQAKTRKMREKIKGKLIFFSLQITFFPGAEYTRYAVQYEAHSVQGTAATGG